MDLALAPYSMGRFWFRLNLTIRVPLAMGFRYNGNDIAVSGDNAISGDAKYKYAI